MTVALTWSWAAAQGAGLMRDAVGTPCCCRPLVNAFGSLLASPAIMSEKNAVR